MTETGCSGGVRGVGRAGYHLRDRDLLIEILDPEQDSRFRKNMQQLVLTTLRRRGMLIALSDRRSGADDCRTVCLRMFKALDLIRLRDGWMTASGCPAEKYFHAPIR